MTARVTVLYDDEADGRFVADHGFSCLIEGMGEKVLFDAGADPGILRANAEALGLDLDVDICVFSHFHADHIGGRSAVRAREYYVLESFWKTTIEELGRRGRVVVVSSPMEIRPWLFTTGPLGDRVIEQSLIVKGTARTLLLTGCGHPGLDRILSSAAGHGVDSVMGGFHGFNNIPVLAGMGLIVPCHCTAHRADIEMAYPDRCSGCGVGATLEL